MLRVLLLVVISLLTLPSQAALFGSNCPEVLKVQEPIWVSKGYQFSESGYRFGFGEARYRDKISYKKQLEQAKLSARQDLVNGIHIIVDTSSGARTLLEKGAGSERVLHHKESRVETRSKLELPGLPVHRLWQNSKTCSIYVQVRISERMIDVLLKKKQVNEFFNTAINKDKTIKVRLQAINEAILLTKKYEFGDDYIGTNSSQMLRKFNAIKHELKNKSLLNNHVIYVIKNSSDVEHPQLLPLLNIMKSSLSGGFETGGSCNSTTMCLQQAAGTSANYASIAVVNLNMSKQNSFWVGDFSTEITLWDLTNNSRKYSSGKQITRVMNRYKHELTLEKGFEKWMREHAEILDSYRDNAREIGGFNDY